MVTVIKIKNDLLIRLIYDCINRYSSIKLIILLSRYTFVDRMKEIFLVLKLLYLVDEISMKFCKKSFIDRYTKYRF